MSTHPSCGEVTLAIRNRVAAPARALLRLAVPGAVVFALACSGVSTGAVAVVRMRDGGFDPISL